MPKNRNGFRNDFEFCHLFDKFCHLFDKLCLVSQRMFATRVGSDLDSFSFEPKPSLSLLFELSNFPFELISGMARKFLIELYRGIIESRNHFQDFGPGNCGYCSCLVRDQLQAWAGTRSSSTCLVKFAVTPSLVSIALLIY